MPNKHAAVKDLRKNHKRAELNARMKTHVKALSSQFKSFIKDGKKAEAQDLARKLQQALDKAGKRMVFHPNKASRRVSTVQRTVVSMK